MSWFIDNANGILILLAIFAAGFVVAWRFNGRVKYLGYAGGCVALMGLVWSLTLIVVTDAKQLERNVHAMADAVVAGNVDELFGHISKDFEYRGVGRELLYQKTRGTLQDRRVTAVRIVHFSVEEISRAKKFARTRFRVSAVAERELPFITEADFVLEGSHWKLKTVRFYDPVQSLQEVNIPGLR